MSGGLSKYYEEKSEREQVQRDEIRLKLIQVLSTPEGLQKLIEVFARQAANSMVGYTTEYSLRELGRKLLEEKV